MRRRSAETCAGVTARLPQSPGTPVSLLAHQNRSGLQMILLQKVVERRPADPEELGRTRDIILAPAHRLSDRLSVSDLASSAKIDGLNFLIGVPGKIEIGRRDAFAIGHNHGSLDAVLELADIAGPAVGIDC